MLMKSILFWVYDKICNYNLFISDEDDYDDDESQDPSIELKYQKYSTRLYVLLLIVCMYVLFYTAMTTTQARTIVISNIDVDKFEKLYLEHGDLLSCPCSTITTTYETFVSNIVRFHPVCSSFFVTQQWIQGLYLIDRSSNGVLDFRTTATSQFQLLSSLCELCKDMTLKSEIDRNKHELVTVYVLSESKVISEVESVVNSLKNSLLTQIISFIDYFRIVTQANNFITALNTNALVFQGISDNGIFFYNLFIDHYPIYKNIQIGNAISCGIIHSTGPTTFDSISDKLSLDEHMDWTNPMLNSTFVNGFYTGCSPFEALLKSTLNCLYDIECLQLFNKYFPYFNQNNLNLTKHVLYSNTTNSNLTVYDHLKNMFIDVSIATPNYSAYFHSCNPLRCTYTATTMINYSYAITLFISLYGGLIMILRLISRLFIKIYFKLKFSSIHRISLWLFIESCKIYLQKLNLFKKSGKRSENDIKRQKIVTRAYLSLFIIAITVLVLFNSLDTQIITINIPNPTLNTYIDLQKFYSHTLRCPCSTTEIPYYKFIRISPILHQICSSNLISDKWLAILKQSATLSAEIDWRNHAYQQFSLLSKLCQLANETVIHAINKLLLQSFIVSNMLTEIDFNFQMDKVLVQLYQSTTVYFSHLIDAIELHTQIDQPYMIRYAYRTMVATFSSIEITRINKNSDVKLAKFTMLSTSSQDIYSKAIDCICSSTVHCQTSAAIFDVDLTVTHVAYPNYSVSYVIPGSSVGCSEMDSLLLSTLECFYSDSPCFSILMNYIKQTYFWNIQDAVWFDVEPLIENSSTFRTRFPRNSSISTIVKEIMIEQWNSSYVYETFYYLCSPSYCFYFEIMRTNNAITLIILLVSVIGGLTISLRLITPHLVVIIMKVFSIIMKKQRRKQKKDLNWFSRLKSMKQKIIRVFYDFLVNLNLFHCHDFGSNIDRQVAKRLGQLTTRLYIVLLILSFILFVIYTLIREQIMTKDFAKPSFDTYNRLTKIYGNKLICSCSSIASVYDDIIHIEPTFHPICSNHFVSNAFINNLSLGLPANLSLYRMSDYRRFILSHIQYLRELCRISIQSVNSSVTQFLSILLISKELLSEQDFNEHIQVLIEDAKQNAPHLLNSIFFLIRNINFGNAIMSTHGTNYRYTVLWADKAYSYFNTEAEIYDNNCSCALYTNCTSQAYFIETNPPNRILLKGLKMGCIPSESLLSSTLECFYDESCLNAIKTHTNYSYSLQPLLPTTRQSNMNSTIGELLKNLFIDEWITSKNYSSYYKQCLPSLCSYSYIQKFSISYIISFILGLQGGLIIVLKWICPRVIRFAMKIKTCGLRKHSNIIHLDNSLEINPINIEDRNVLNMTYFRSRLLKIILSCLIIIALLVILIILSIFVIQHGNQSIRITVSSTTTTTTASTKVYTTTTILKSLTTTMSVSQQILKKTSIYTDYDIDSSSVFIGDFNNDEQPDLGLATIINDNLYSSSNSTIKIVVLLGNGDGTFTEQLLSLVLVDYDINSMKVIVGNFNHDKLLDIGIYDKYFLILIGNGDGTFNLHATVVLDSDETSGDISAADVNSDNYMDIITTSSNFDGFVVYYGNANGTFMKESISDNRTYNFYYSLVTSDLNNDNFMDIVILNKTYRTIVTYLGYGNGSFDVKRTSFTGGSINPIDIIISDFNEDNISDIIATYSIVDTLYILFGYGNGTFGDSIKLTIDTATSDDYIPKMTIIDFNRDGHLDIAVCQQYPYIIIILYGDGLGSFEQYEIFSIENVFECISIAAADLNTDGYQDIIVTSNYSVDIFLNTDQYIKTDIQRVK